MDNGGGGNYLMSSSNRITFEGLPFFEQSMVCIIYNYN